MPRPGNAGLGGHAGFLGAHPISPGGAAYSAALGAVRFVIGPRGSRMVMTQSAMKMIEVKKMYCGG